MYSFKLGEYMCPDFISDIKSQGQGTRTQADSSYDVKCTVLDSDTKNTDSILRVKRGLRDTRENKATEVLESEQRAGDMVQCVLSTCKALGLKTSSAKQQPVGTCETTNIRKRFPRRGTRIRH